MRAGPVRRAAGTLGLLALVPTAVMLVRGDVTMQVAAVRAGITLGSVVLLARIATWAVGWIADSALDGARDAAPDPARSSARPAAVPPGSPGAAAPRQPPEAPDRQGAPLGARERQEVPR